MKKEIFLVAGVTVAVILVVTIIDALKQIDRIDFAIKNAGK
ncbi:MAG: hypothetical protein ABIA11_01935 [Patescibacteria group bacterium]